MSFGASKMQTTSIVPLAIATLTEGCDSGAITPGQVLDDVFARIARPASGRSGSAWPHGGFRPNGLPFAVSLLGRALDEIGRAHV